MSQLVLIPTADTPGVGFTTVTELPLRLHRVEPDPFLESPAGEPAGCAEFRSGTRDLTTAPRGKRPLYPDELRARSRHPELAA